MKLIKGLLVGVGVGASLLMVGCDDDDDDPVVGQGEIRVIHASPDAPPVNVLLDGSAAIENLDYGESSGFSTLTAASYDIDVEGIIPGGNQTVISVPDFEIAAGDSPTVIAVGDVSTIAPLVVQPSSSTAGADEVTVVAVHAAPVAGNVEVFLTAPGASVVGATPAFEFDFQGSVDAGALPAGDVELQVTLNDSLVYNSGGIDLSGFAGEDLFIVAVNSVTEIEQLASPIKLLAVIDGDVIELLDADTATGARVVHGSPDAPAVEVFATSSVLGTDAVELVDNFAYTDVVPGMDSFVDVPAGDYVFDVAPDTDSIGDSVFTSGAITLEQGSEYSVIAAGFLLSRPGFELLATEDNNRSIATQASVKVIHAAPAAGDVNVFVTPAGTVSVADIESANGGTPLLQDFAFGEITDYVPVAPGSYDIRVAAGGTVAINLAGVPLSGGDVYNIIARGPAVGGGDPTDFGVILLAP